MLNISYKKANHLPVNIHPIGAITKNTEGKELAEMYDMRASGAIAFSDGINSVQSAGLLLKALQYVKAFDGTLIQLPDDKSINPHGLMNEGIISTQLGLARQTSYGRRTDRSKRYQTGPICRIKIAFHRSEFKKIIGIH